MDIGSGTTGIAVLRGGQVTYVADRPHGDTFPLVLARQLRCDGL